MPIDSVAAIAEATSAVATSEPVKASVSPTVGILSVLASAFFGAFFAFLFARFGEWRAAKLARGKVHRNALVRLERVATDYLNEIITNRKLAVTAATALHEAKLYWKFPHLFEVDRSFAVDILDLDMVRLVVEMNTNLRRYNHDIEDLRRTHGELQAAHLGGTLPPDAWVDLMRRMAPHWAVFESVMNEFEKDVSKLIVRQRLLVAQYDSSGAGWLRLFGTVKTWPLEESVVARDQKAFEAERKQLLDESRTRQDAKRQRAEAIARGERIVDS